MVDALKKCGVNGDVTPNTTVLDGRVEAGCRVLVVSEPVRENTWRVWEAVRARCVLRCAHVELRGATSAGCVFDVYRPSVCPGPEEDAAAGDSLM